LISISFISCFLNSKYHVKSNIWSNEKSGKKFHTKSLFTNIHRTYRSLCLSITFIVRLFILIDQITRRFFIFIEKIIRIIRIVHGWIQMLQSIFTALHLIISRLMILTFKIYRIFYLLSILFEPFSNRTFEKAVRSFSHFLYEYYSSNGACYTLKARTYHFLSKVRAKWNKNQLMITDDDIYYDALNEEY
jgi:hypothetical protein